MNITLTPKLATIVKKQLSTGRYRSAGAVVGEALQLLQYNNRTDEEKLADLKREIELGLQQLDRGEGIEFDESVVDEVCRAGRERQKRKRPKTKSA